MEKSKNELKESYLIERVFKKNYFVLLFGMMTMVICNIVDSAITGQFLGEKAVAAIGLIAPVVAIITVIISIFSMGCGQLASRYVGKADAAGVNRVFSTQMCTGAGISIVTFLVLLFFSENIVQLLGKTANHEIISFAADYLRGYSFGIVPLAVGLILNSLMTIDSDQKRCIIYVMIVLFTDIILDILNVTYFYAGMFGMSLATSISSFIGMIVMLLHFTKEGHILHFTIKNFDVGCLKEAFMIGISQSVNQLANTCFIFILNNLLLYISGSRDLAAFAVANVAFMIVYSILGSLSSVTSIIMNLSYGEEDKSSLRRILRISIISGYRVGMILLILLFVFAENAAGIFIKNQDTAVLTQAVRFIRFIAVENVFLIFSYSVLGSFMGTGHISLNYLLGFLRDGVYPSVCTAILGLLFGIQGLETGFIAAGIITFVTCILIPCVRNKKFPRAIDDFLILSEDFDTKPEELLEVSINSATDISDISEKVRQFCLMRGESKRNSMFLSLFVEEMAGNTFKHGSNENKKIKTELRLLLKKGKRIIRLRDNGNRFDPVKWLEVNNPKDPEKGLGIRMIVGLAKEVKYISSMELNTIIINLEQD
ncbi:MAG: ATP-binding protein [Firmicutes bacterium]|nr:ATP-binding protein [Bacillota bacterium]